MNRFRTKKKGKDDVLSDGRSLTEVESSGPFRLFGRKKVQDDEPKRDVDLAAALPPSDDFRTSLLMTGLSARFSMLREQDDPYSKLGKASDDSVLFPKRQSRMVAFGGPGSGLLQDIAEVDLLQAPKLGRLNSYQSDDAASTAGSMMGRAKPVEGNNLFGGRQKIYKLAAGSRAGMSGRALYDDDVATSSFQRWRQAEKERRSYEEGRSNDTFEAESSLSYNRRRETSSTASSVPSATRDSTAATSISSQPSSVKDTQSAIQLPGLERSATRTRRLYEQGLTQDLQEHQSSALSRMDTLSKQRPLGPLTPDSTIMPSPTSSFGDRGTDRRQLFSKASAPNLRSFSPSAVALSPVSPADTIGKVSSRQEPKAANFGLTPPLSPPASETEDHPALTIQPGDRGKATAMGLFNRPAGPYDQALYAQRQLQLQKGGDPALSRYTSKSSGSSTAARSRSSSAQRTSMEDEGPQAMRPGSSNHHDASVGGHLFDDSDGGSFSNRATVRTAPRLHIEQPRDHDDAAYRKSALPTPLSMNSPRDAAEQASFQAAGRPEMPAQSPGLSPSTGLSGMVRHHLRNESAASSVYSPASHEVEFGGMDLAARHWSATHDADSTDGDNADADADADAARDDFAQSLAIGARRVRDRLTNYVESDHDQSVPSSHFEQNTETRTTKARGLGVLQSSPSREYPEDNAERERGRSQAFSEPNDKLLQTSGMGSSSRHGSSSRDGSHGGESPGKVGAHDASGGRPDERAQAGLKAFQRARRELQKMKELEVQQRYSQKSTSSPESGGPSPTMYNRMAPWGNDQSWGHRSRVGSRATPERERSDSETSLGGRGRAYSRGNQAAKAAVVTYDDNDDRAYAKGASFGTNSTRQVLESPVAPPYRAPKVGMSPSHSVGALGSSSPYRAPGMRSPRQDNQQYGRSRTGSLLGAAASTPNLQGSAPAPPLPPINPRRKNGFTRGNDADAATSSHDIFGLSDAYVGGGDGSPNRYRDRVHVNGPLQQSPPRARPPTSPRFGEYRARLPGGML